MGDEVNKTVILSVIMLLLLSVSVVSAEVIVFDKYDTKTTLKDGKLIVTKELRLRNVGPNPIIPGEVHFKLSQETKKGVEAPEIEGFSVVDKFGKKLDTREYDSAEGADLVFTVWDPLLPNFVYEMTMTYEISFKPKGVLFYHVLLPEERTTIPVKESSTEFTLPKRYHVTYFSPDGETYSEKDGNVVNWDVKDAYYVEYSVVPFPRLGIKGVNVFWTLIIILFLVNLFFRMKKKARLAGQQ